MRANQEPCLTQDFDGAWHVFDARSGETRELVGAGGMELAEVRPMIETLYADTLPGRNPAQRRLL